MDELFAFPASTERLNPRDEVRPLALSAEKSSAVNCTLKPPFRSNGFVKWPITTMEIFIGQVEVGVKRAGDSWDKTFAKLFHSREDSYVTRSYSRPARGRNQYDVT